jgi:phosphotransferase system enzyme I (PtsP)
MTKVRKIANQEVHPLVTLEDISRLVSHSQDLQDSLKRIVAITAERMETEVCSLYLLDRQMSRLILCATKGLALDTVGEVSMRIDEGLTGLVLERMRPVVVVDAMTHPRYKYFPETGEERFHSFLGVPITERRTPVGVLVVQTSRRREFSPDEVRLFTAISAQASNIIIQARLADSLKDKERERLEYHKRWEGALKRLRTYEGRGRERGRMDVRHKWRGRLTGRPASPGFGYGTAYIMRPWIDLGSVKKKRTKTPAREIEKLRSALAKSIEQVAEFKQRMTALISKEAGAIFEVHRMILEDHTLVEQLEAEISQERHSAEYAVSRVFQQHLREFEQIEDQYLKDRAVDIRDVAQRVMQNLSGTRGDGKKAAVPRKAILVAGDLSPADVTLIEGDHFQGIVLSTGGVTSHASLLAKSFEIPTVVAVENLLETVREGDSLIVDGNSGVIYLNPNQEIHREYDRLERDYLAFNRQLDEIRELPAETPDGHRVSLYANVGLMTDVTSARTHGAQGVGLYRTEIPFLAHHDFPNEDEQYALYRRVVEEMGGKPVTIRTLDIGADKYPPYVRRVDSEANPFLGWRSIRISLEVAEIFRTQLRAILKAGALGQVRLLIPMVSSLEEVLKVKAILAEVKEELEQEGVPYDRTMQLGIMVEVPSVVQMASRLSREVDFLSIGTNDLIQYLLAVDRGNRRVAGLYEPLHPAVLSTIMQVIQAAKSEGKRVGMCGEMAGDPLYTLLLLGMGLEEFSMESLYIPVVKKVVRTVTLQAARESAEIVLRMDTVGEIKKFLFGQMRDLGMVELLEVYH